MTQPRVIGEETFDFLRLVKTQVMRQNSDYYIVRAKAVADRDESYRNRKKGDVFEVVWSFVRGMTDNGQPGWSDMSPNHYNTPEEARGAVSSHAFYGGKIDPDSIEVRRVVERVISYRDEYGVEEAEAILVKEREGFRNFMATR